jgi:toxin-antitoxin system PIN domain toxin
MLVDANLLIYAADRRSRFHQSAQKWLLGELNGSRRVGLPWQSLATFLRVITHAGISAHPLSPADAWRTVSAWLDSEVAWIPEPGAGYGPTFGDLLTRYEAIGNLVPDAQLAALALEHGLTIYSADTDFARFTEVSWVNPLA